MLTSEMRNRILKTHILSFKLLSRGSTIYASLLDFIFSSIPLFA